MLSKVLPSISFSEDLIHSKFEKVAHRYAGAIAISFENEKLTYQQLNEKANHLANCLLEAGVIKKQLVGLYLDRSLEMIICMLAVLKIGATYVPLDPHYPEERITYIIQDSNMKLLLTNETYLSKLAKASCTTMDVNNATAFPRVERISNLHIPVEPSQPAYVIYTSGSTGLPKGVLVSHKNVVRLFEQTRAWFHFSEHDVWSQFHSYAFDFSVWEIWGALLHGGRLAIVPYWISRSFDDFYQFLVDEKITILNQSPSAFSQLLHAKQLQQGASQLRLREVIFGGEKLNPQILKPWFNAMGVQGPNLINMYGITETTVHATYKKLTEKDIEETNSLIGQPIPDLKLYILDEQLKIVPQGSIGEIVISGPGVSLGYLNKPDITKDKFIELPSLSKETLYRSGDLGRYLENGEIEYLGRSDSQIKIRGFRIEAGEIEHALLQHPHIQSAIVTGEKDEEGVAELVAYIIKTESQALQFESIRLFLKEKLPEHMLPGSLVFVEQFPLTVNGKTDYRALKETRIKQKEAAKPIAMPRNELEEAVLIAWQEVFGQINIGINDNFFELGGHSMLAAKLLWKLRNLIDPEIPLRAIFMSPTIAEFCEKELTQVKQERMQGQALLINPRKNKALNPLTYSQKGIWFQEQLKPDSNAYHMVFSAAIKGDISLTILEQSLQLLIMRHDVLRASFTNDRGVPRQDVHNNMNFQLKVIHIETEAPLSIDLADQSLFELSLKAGTLFRTILLTNNRKEQLLIVAIHHIISDATSIEKLLGDIQALYHASLHKANSVESLSLQYADYASWQETWLTGEESKNQLDYWREKLEGAPSFLSLPTDFSRQDIPTFQGGFYRFRLPEVLYRQAKELAKSQNVTLFSLLLSAWSLLLHLHTKQEDIVIGTSASSRKPEIADLIGLFVNTLPIRSRLWSHGNGIEFLKQINNALLEGFSNQELPFEYVLSELKIPRAANRLPLCQVFFSYRASEEISLKDTVFKFTDLQHKVSMVPFEMNIEIVDNQVEASGIFEYSSDLFKQESIIQLLQDFYIVLELLVKFLENPLSTIIQRIEENINASTN